MTSVSRSPSFQPKRSFREKRALIACKRCRRLKKRCKPGGSAKCQRCIATGNACIILSVADETSSSHATSSPSPAPYMLVEEPTLQDIFCYPSQSGVQPADLSLSPLHPSLTEPSQHSDQTPPSHAPISMLGGHALSSSFAPTAHHRYDQDTPDASHALSSYYDEYPPFHNDTYDGPSANATFANSYPPNGEPNFEIFILDNPINASQPRSPYGASNTYSTYPTYSQDASASIHYIPCSHCSGGHCVVHSSEPHYHSRILRLQGKI